MMTMETVLELLGTAGDDIEIYVCDSTPVVFATIQDFEGFDDNWCEIERPYNEKRIEAIQKAMQAGALATTEFFGMLTFEFDGFSVQWKYESWDI